MSPSPKSVCVFCGSRPGADPGYMAAAEALRTVECSVVLDTAAIFAPEVLHRLVDSTQENCLLFDGSRQPAGSSIGIALHEGRVVDFGRRLGSVPGSDALGVMPGLFRIGSMAAACIADECERFEREGLADSCWEEAVRGVLRSCPLAFGIEDISGLPGLALPAEEGGVGFDYRFAMGIADNWIRLTKDVADENWRPGHIWYELTNRRAHEKSISYAECHDQALVGDQTLIFRLAGAAMYHHMHRDDPDPAMDRAMALHKMIRLITLATLFLIHRYKAESIHYVTPTDDNVGQTKGMQQLGLFDDVNVEIGDIIVARIDQEKVPALLKQDRVDLKRLINKE